MSLFLSPSPASSAVPLGGLGSCTTYLIPCHSIHTAEADTALCSSCSRCAGVTFRVANAAGQTSAECKLIFGNKDLGEFKRTFLRAAVDKTKPAEVVN